MSENGFNLVGLLRSLQAEASGIFFLALVLIVIYLIIKWVCIRTDIGDDERAAVLRTVRRIMVGIQVVGIVIFIFVGLGRIGANRTPRSDVDKSGVYQQMDSHKSERLQ